MMLGSKSILKTFVICSFFFLKWLHLDGAITPRIAKKLAALQGIEPPYEGEQLNNALSVGEDCQSLNEFLQCFDLPLKLLQTKEGISEAIYLVQEELKAEGLSYAELRFAPQLHCQGGLSQAQVIEAPHCHVI